MVEGMDMAGRTFKKGDVVRVKDTVECPDDEETSIGGWQGRVVEVEEDEDAGGDILVEIEWDSVTLKKAPAGYFERGGAEGLACFRMLISQDEVEPARARDFEGDVRRAQQAIATRYAFFGEDDQDRRIREVLEDMDPSDESKCQVAWDAYLRKVLTFPFEAQIWDYEDDGPLRQRDRVKVTGFSDLIDGSYGIIMDVRLERRKYAFPLAGLRPLDEESKIFQVIDDYSVWFANH